MALFGIPKDLKDLMNSKKPGVALALLAAGTLIYHGIKAGCRSLGNHIDERAKRKTNKMQADRMTEFENLKFEHRKAERAEKEEYARRRRQESKSSQETNTTPEEVYTPKGRSLGEQIKECVAELRCLVDGMIELGGFFILLGMEKIGKSTFLMQLALGIANGANFEFLPQDEQNTHSPMKVLYIDLEMKIRELKKRLKNIAIPTNLLWESEINNIGSLICYIRENIKGCTECVVILDNLKKMAEKSTNHYEVSSIFKALQDLQKELSLEGITLTIIVANHTVKGYDQYKPISTSYAASSVEISQFSTGMIAIAPAKDGMTMIKKVTSRNFPNDDTVLVVEMVHEPFQHFKFVKKCTEAEALPIAPKACKESSMVEDDCCDEMDNPTYQKIYNAFAERGLDEQSIADVLKLDEGGQMIKLNKLGVKQEKIAEIYDCSSRTVKRRFKEWKMANGIVKRPKKVS